MYTSNFSNGQKKVNISPKILYDKYVLFLFLF